MLQVGTHNSVCYQQTVSHKYSRYLRISNISLFVHVTFVFVSAISNTLQFHFQKMRTYPTFPYAKPVEQSAGTDRQLLVHGLHKSTA
jgi:hypothetical protein